MQHVLSMYLACTLHVAVMPSQLPNELYVYFFLLTRRHYQSSSEHQSLLPLMYPLSPSLLSGRILPSCLVIMYQRSKYIHSLVDLVTSYWTLTFSKGVWFQTVIKLVVMVTHLSLLLLIMVYTNHHGDPSP